MQQKQEACTIAVCWKDGGIQTTLGTDSESIYYRLGENTRLVVRLSKKHLELESSASEGVEFRFDTLVLLKRYSSEAAALQMAPQQEIVELVHSSRFIFQTADPDDDIGVPCGTVFLLPLSESIEVMITAGTLPHFRLELDFIYRMDTRLPSYTNIRENPAFTDLMFVTKDDASGLAPVFINQKLLCAHSNRYQKQIMRRESTRPAFADISLTQCVAFLRQVYGDKELSWSDVFLVLQSAELFESKTIWNRCASFILKDSRRSLEYKLRNAFGAVRHEDAKWSLIKEIIARTSVKQERKMFDDGFNAYSLFTSDDDRRKAAQLFDRHRAGKLVPTPNIYQTPERHFDKPAVHSIAVRVRGTPTILYINAGVFQCYFRQPMESVTPGDKKALESCVRFLLDRRPMPMEELNRLLRFTANYQKPSFKITLENAAIRYYSILATVDRELTPELLLSLLWLAFEHRLQNLKTMVAFWVQCSNETFFQRFKQLLDKLEYSSVAPHLETFVRQARYLGWTSYNRRFSNGTNVSA